MKKIVVSAFSLFVLGAVSANAQTATQAPATQTQTPATQTQTPAAGQSTTQSTTTTAPATQEEEKTAVTVEELPEAVKTTLASTTLKPWTPTEAYLVKGVDGKEYYAINLKKDDQTGSVKLDKEGKPVK